MLSQFSNWTERKDREAKHSKKQGKLAPLFVRLMLSDIKVKFSLPEDDGSSSDSETEGKGDAGGDGKSEWSLCLSRSIVG